MKIITIANQKGGVGKTAISCHLAFHLRDTGHQVLFIDIDPQANATATLKASNSGVSASDLFKRNGNIDCQAHEDAAGQITLVSADAALADIERQDAEVVAAFKENLSDIEGKGFDFVVIDTAPTLGLRMTAALYSSHFVLCPIELESYSVQGITSMLQTIFGIKKKYNPALTFLGMLPNRCNSHSPAQKQNFTELMESYAELMVAAKIGNRSSVAEALGTGVPVWEIPKTAARKAGKEMREALSLVMQKVEGDS